MSAPAEDGDGDGDDEGEWRFSLSDLEEAESEGPVQQPIEPGSPELENVAFVLLGVVLALAVLFAGI